MEPRVAAITQPTTTSYSVSEQRHAGATETVNNGSYINGRYFELRSKSPVLRCQHYIRRRLYGTTDDQPWQEVENAQTTKKVAETKEKVTKPKIATDKEIALYFVCEPPQTKVIETKNENGEVVYYFTNIPIINPEDLRDNECLLIRPNTVEPRMQSYQLERSVQKAEKVTINTSEKPIMITKKQLTPEKCKELSVLRQEQARLKQKRHLRLQEAQKNKHVMSF